MTEYILPMPATPVGVGFSLKTVGPGSIVCSYIGPLNGSVTRFRVGSSGIFEAQGPTIFAVQLVQFTSHSYGSDFGDSMACYSMFSGSARHRPLTVPLGFA